MFCKLIGSAVLLAAFVAVAMLFATATFFRQQPSLAVLIFFSNTISTSSFCSVAANDAVFVDRHGCAVTACCLLLHRQHHEATENHQKLTASSSFLFKVLQHPLPWICGPLNCETFLSFTDDLWWFQASSGVLLVQVSPWWSSFLELVHVKLI